ncbi:MAG: hypothetical protein IK144_10270 [Bacteroidaceae bacterium]|nr:hypothetical protein [Bacteroidaceae bacterium]
MIKEYNQIIMSLFEGVDRVRKESPSAGTKYRLMGLAADITEVAQTLQTEVLDVVSREAVLDVDADMDYAELSEQVLAQELQERIEMDDTTREQTRLTNEALGALSGVLAQIADGLERHRKDEEFERLYEAEKRRYMNSGTSKRARQTFEQWKDYECYGHPLQEQIEDYRIEKVMQMFEKGVFNERVEHMQRAKRYPGELDLDQLGDNPKISKTVSHHYAALRRMVDFRDGQLVIDPVRVGRHFYASRHEENAKQNRTQFLKYMHKVEMVQEEYRKLLAAQMEASANEAEEAEPLNFFAPSKNLKVLLAEEWFSVLTANEELYTRQWTEQFVEALMHSEWGEQVAREWAVMDKRLTLKCMIIGQLKDAGVLKGSYNQIAKLLDLDGENPATLAKYMGLGKKQPYAEWIENYVKSK